MGRKEGREEGEKERRRREGGKEGGGREEEGEGEEGEGEEGRRRVGRRREEGIVAKFAEIMEFPQFSFLEGSKNVRIFLSSSKCPLPL